MIIDEINQFSHHKYYACLTLMNNLQRLSLDRRTRYIVSRLHSIFDPAVHHNSSHLPSFLLGNHILFCSAVPSDSRHPHTIGHFRRALATGAMRLLSMAEYCDHPWQRREVSRDSFVSYV
jgi:hypothetical protein